MNDAPARPACTAPRLPSTSRVSAAATTCRVGALTGPGGGRRRDRILQCTAARGGRHGGPRRSSGCRRTRGRTGLASHHISVAPPRNSITCAARSSRELADPNTRRRASRLWTHTCAWRPIARSRLPAQGVLTSAPASAAAPASSAGARFGSPGPRGLGARQPGRRRDAVGRDLWRGTTSEGRADRRGGGERNGGATPAGLGTVLGSPAASGGRPCRTSTPGAMTAAVDDWPRTGGMLSVDHHVVSGFRAAPTGRPGLKT